MAAWLLLLAFAGGASARYYCEASNATCWPTSSQLQGLQQQLTGELVTEGQLGYNTDRQINNLRFQAFPVGIAYVKTLPDIQAVVAFARSHLLRLSVRSTGHDYDGRNTGNATLQINLKHMDGKYRRENGTVTVEPGAIWGDVFKFVSQFHSGYEVVVGGADASVGVAGWMLGGGHSPISRSFGLGVDNVESVEMVSLADGSPVTASATQNADLFWALRGGGGGTFGIVTNITYRTHMNPTTVTAVTQVFPLMDLGVRAANLTGDFLAKADLPNAIGGYYVVTCSPSGVGNAIILALLYNGPQEQALADLEPLLNQTAVYALDTTVTLYLSFYSWQAQQKPDTGGSSNYLVTSFVDPAGLATAGGGLAGAIPADILANGCPVQSDASAFFQCTGTLLGGATTEPSINSTAVHPAFRSARMAMSCGGVWSTAGSQLPLEQALDEWADRVLYPAGSGASYVNEPPSYAPDWQQRFWGPTDRYDQLVATAARFDPDRMLDCHHCVGWEPVDGGSDDDL